MHFTNMLEAPPRSVNLNRRFPRTGTGALFATFFCNTGEFGFLAGNAIRVLKPRTIDGTMLEDESRIVETAVELESTVQASFVQSTEQELSRLDEVELEDVRNKVLHILLSLRRGHAVFCLS